MMFTAELQRQIEDNQKALIRHQGQALETYYQGLSILQNQLLEQAPPSRRDEDWRYSNLQFFRQANYNLKSPIADNTIEYRETDRKVVLRLFDTSPQAQLQVIGELPQGLRVESGASSPAAQTMMTTPWTYSNYFADLNRALVQDRLFVIIDKKLDPTLMLEVIIGAEAGSAHPRFTNIKLNVLVEPGAEATFLEKQTLAAQTFTNSAIDYEVKAQGRLTVAKFEQGPGRGVHTSRFRLAQDSQARVVTLTQGSEWSRHNLFADLQATGASIECYATYLAYNQQYIDHHTLIDHVAGATTSHQQYMGVLDGKAQAVFNGKVRIHRGAQKSSALQSNKNLLLSSQAEVDTKPELQIDADDVQAKHGATVGQLNPEEIFYLQSRGYSRSQAEAALMQGFVQEIGFNLPAALQPVFANAVNEGLRALKGE